MRRLFIVALIVAGLSACSSAPEPEMNDETKESIYLQTGNYGELVNLYQQQLEQDDQIEVRLKLVETYLHLEDAENALFYLEPVIEEGSKECKVFDYQAQALVMNAEFQQAQASALKALELCPDRAETENLLGIIYANQYDFKQARTYFNHARRNFYNVATVTNNLAVLDIAEEKYAAAMERLLAVYKQYPADQRIKANLVLSIAKQKNYALFFQVMESEYSDSEIEAIYHALKNYHPQYHKDAGHFIEGEQ